MMKTRTKRRKKKKKKKKKLERKEVGRKVEVEKEPESLGKKPSPHINKTDLCLYLFLTPFSFPNVLL